MAQELETNKSQSIGGIILWLIPVNAVIFEIALNFGGIFAYSSYLILPIINILIIAFLLNNRNFIFSSISVLFLSLVIPAVIIFRTLNTISPSEIGPVFLGIGTLTTWFVPFLAIIAIRYPDFLSNFISITKKQNNLGLYIGLICLIAVYISTYKIRRYANAMLYFSCGLTLIYFHYGLLTKNKKFLLGILLWIVIAIVSNKREDLLYCALALSGFFVFRSIKNSDEAFLIRICTVILISTLLVFSGSLVKFMPSLIPEKYKKRNYSYKNELFLDSRTAVKKDFWRDMKNDMLLGRGLTGTYSTPEFAPDYNTYHGGRNVIEIGHLQILLKGGLVSLCIYLIIILTAVFLGFLRSKNLLTQIFSFLIVNQLIIMFWARTPGADPNFMLLWLLVGFNFSSNIRNLSNEEIYNILA